MATEVRVPIFMFEGHVDCDCPKCYLLERIVSDRRLAEGLSTVLNLHGQHVANAIGEAQGTTITIVRAVAPQNVN